MQVLALVDAPDHVCCRYRIGAFAPALGRQGGTLVVQGLARGVLARLRQFRDAQRFDAVVLQRKLLAGWQLAALRHHARRLVFDFDDAVLLRDSYDRRGHDDPRRVRRFAATIRAADQIIAGNAELAAHAARVGAGSDRVAVIPTCVDPNEYRPRLEPNRGTGLDLVWIGSASTLQGLVQERPLWERIAAAVPGVRLRVICDRFPDLGAMPVVPVPWSRATEAGALAAGDVGISHIPDDPWSRGKCGLKVVQCQAAGLPVVANPVGVHPALIEPGVTGFLPADPAAWVAAIRALADDPDRRQAMGHAARAAVEARCSVAAWDEAVVAAWTGVPAPPPDRVRTRATRSRQAASGAIG